VKNLLSELHPFPFHNKIVLLTDIFIISTYRSWPYSRKYQGMQESSGCKFQQQSTSEVSATSMQIMHS